MKIANIIILMLLTVSTAFAGCYAPARAQMAPIMPPAPMPMVAPNDPSGAMMRQQMVQQQTQAAQQQMQQQMQQLQAQHQQQQQQLAQQQQQLAQQVQQQQQQIQQAFQQRMQQIQQMR